jgi:molybdopterin/thiamine biosynthesis adenylyltransferase
VLSEAQIQRYSRHILLREVGGRRQQRLLDARVSIASLNEGGRAAAMWLARAGVGAVVLPEDSRPCPATDSSGLLFASDAGRPLSEAVRERLLFHAPHLGFEGSETHSLSDLSSVEAGTRAAVSLVRQIVGH